MVASQNVKNLEGERNRLAKPEYAEEKETAERRSRKNQEDDLDPEKAGCKAAGGQETGGLPVRSAHGREARRRSSGRSAQLLQKIWNFESEHNRLSKQYSAENAVVDALAHDTQEGFNTERVGREANEGDIGRSTDEGKNSRTLLPKSVKKVFRSRGRRSVSSSRCTASSRSLSVYRGSLLSRKRMHAKFGMI